MVLMRRSAVGPQADQPVGFAWTFVPRRKAAPPGEAVEDTDRAGPSDPGLDLPTAAGTGASVAAAGPAVITAAPLPEPTVVVIDLPRSREVPRSSAAATVTGVISR